jgi:hypothetical protein
MQTVFKIQKQYVFFFGLVGAPSELGSSFGCI